MMPITITISTAVAGSTKQQWPEQLHKQQLKILTMLFNLPATYTGSSCVDYPPGVYHSGVASEAIRFDNGECKMVLSGKVEKMPSLFGLLCKAVNYRTKVTASPHRLKLECSYEFIARNLFAKLYFKTFILQKTKTLLSDRIVLMLKW